MVINLLHMLLMQQELHHLLFYGIYAQASLFIPYLLVRIKNDDIKFSVLLFNLNRMAHPNTEATHLF